MGVNVAEPSPRGAVGTQVGHLEIGVFVGETHQFAAGVAGSSEDGDGVGHGCLVGNGRGKNIRICV
jgi:hypothetical protein